ncbi:MAG TPA: hypothetical protein VFD36_27740, partial [Kofleriaceae bacterium]|nr:hypothetical protein [Kofleriaceae bacterium]
RCTTRGGGAFAVPHASSTALDATSKLRLVDHVAARVRRSLARCRVVARVLGDKGMVSTSYADAAVDLPVDDPPTRRRGWRASRQGD